ncbi:hypothetical protein K491DRAFT_619611 [Lophiostoma macrostomum CBS 122681]|uniref:Uncharacterized protein n=1 Tax=Lophiostoma macrostomum CBS 122681 TaxID=1314788 RepID=A0A6A6TR83_9PLEO|nr:hypothetical protein K491DRAFT_619611 [Lophiostoma macrostomum CBS 122681]
MSFLLCSFQHEPSRRVPRRSSSARSPGPIPGYKSVVPSRRNACVGGRTYSSTPGSTTTSISASFASFASCCPVEKCMLIHVFRIFASPPSLVPSLSEIQSHWFPPFVVETIAVSFKDRPLATSRLTAMSLAYKVEELLALRDSVSESAVSIDKFADEDVIKEHVLRPSVSANAIGTGQPDKPFRPATTTPGVSLANTNLKKPSPSPSIKRGKAERLLKEHGSPPGLRVTAGGRIVPSDLPPLRFGNNNNNNNIKPHSLRGVDPSTVMSVQMQPEVNNNNHTPEVQLMGTQPVIISGGRMYALPAYTGPNFQVPSVVPPIQEIPKQNGDNARLPIQGGVPGIPFAPQRNNTPLATVGLDVSTLQTQYDAKKIELRTVEQTEVLQADTQGPAWRQGMIAKKKSLILELDALRKQIDKMRDAECSSSVGATGLGPAIGLQGPMPPATTPSMAFLPQYPQAVTQSLGSDVGALSYGVPPQSSYPPLLMYQPFNALSGTQFQSNMPQPTKAPHSPGSATRRSHAVPIKKPQEDVKKPGIQYSTLDPKSPTYEPALKTNGKLESQAPPTPSPAKRSPWRSNEVGSAQSNTNEDRVLSQKPSLSSIDTTDFFPTNTHEHSSTRIAPNKISKQPSQENTAAPTTPEKPWAFGPWNPPSDGQSKRAGLSIMNDSTRKLTSWPEAFGKSSSLSSSGHKTLAESGMLSGNLRKSSAQYTATESNWPLIASKAIDYVPSTYQEGYQAGLHHMGLPNNVEVLHGFVDGIMAYLKEHGSKDSKTRNGFSGMLPAQHDYSGSSSARSSLRGVLSGATLYDSGIGLAENIRSAKMTMLPSTGYAKPAYSPRMDGVDGPIMYTLCNEAAREPPQRQQASAATLQEQNPLKSPIGLLPGKDEQAHTKPQLGHLAASRQFSGARIENRAYGTPASMQRYYPTPKEMGTGPFAADLPLSARAPNRQRFSGLDGAMDDLAGLVGETKLEETATVETMEAEASCFKSSSGKGKQKIPSYPSKSASGNGRETASPSKVPSSPKKSGEHSPAKARLEQVTNKLRRPKKEDVRAMSPEDKQKRTEKWRKRFRQIKDNEQQDIEKYIRENPRSNESRR